MVTLESIKKIVAEQLSVEIGTIVEDSKFVEDLGADSLDVVELVMALEEEYEVEISDDDAASLATPKDVIEYLNK